MKTGGIAVLPVSMFDISHHLFWMGSLERILEKYPLLEQPHRQSFYMLLCIEQARGNVVIDNETILLDQHMIIYVKPNSVFSLDIERAATGSIICFTEEFFSLRYNNNVLHQFSFLKRESGNYANLDEMQSHKWQLLAELMQQEFYNRHRGADKVLRSFLNILLYGIDRSINPVASGEGTNTKEEKIRQFETLLEDNYVKHKIPSFYAGQLHITTNYLNRLCKQYKGVSSGELIRKRVTIEAQRLLHYTVLSVAEIASELGFESVSYFVTFFKKNTGMTTENFKKFNHQ
jgi:AraC family transcriptional regulator, transcriptional activator of pobA